MNINRKNLFKVSIAFLLLIVIILVRLKLYTQTKLLNIDYRTDIAPLQERFTNLGNIQSAYWKSGAYNGASFFGNLIGPTDYWLKGFILLSDTDYDIIQSEYNWDETEITFDDGINPSITGFDSYKWYSSEDINEQLIYYTYHLMGEFYLDKRNKILYFDVNTY